jgi:hypothetical protein
MAARKRRSTPIGDCQSCGMPLARDARGGTEADGSPSRDYCSHCYQRGRFVMPDLTVHAMQQRVASRLAEVGIPDEAARALTRRIPALKRWTRPGKDPR